jgi:hypothetical protein
MAIAAKIQAFIENASWIRRMVEEGERLRKLHGPDNVYDFTIGNPNTTAAHVTATFLFDDGTTCETTATVGPLSRYNFWVDTIVIPGCPRSLADAAVSTTVTSDLAVVAERTMWWPGPSAATWTEAHNAAGATTTGTEWGLADGEQGGARSNETYILIANTSNYAGKARVTLYFDDGTAPVFKDFELKANSRSNVPVGSAFGQAVAGKKFGSVIESLRMLALSYPIGLWLLRWRSAEGPAKPEHMPGIIAALDRCEDLGGRFRLDRERQLRH